MKNLQIFVVSKPDNSYSLSLSLIDYNQKLTKGTTFVAHFTGRLSIYASRVLKKHRSKSHTFVLKSRKDERRKKSLKRKIKIWFFFDIFFRKYLKIA